MHCGPPPFLCPKLLIIGNKGWVTMGTMDYISEYECLIIMLNDHVGKVLFHYYHKNAIYEPNTRNARLTEGVHWQQYMQTSKWAFLNQALMKVYF